MNPTYEDGFLLQPNEFLLKRNNKKRNPNRWFFFSSQVWSGEIFISGESSSSVLLLMPFFLDQGRVRLVENNEAHGVRGDLNAVVVRLTDDLSDRTPTHRLWHCEGYAKVGKSNNRTKKEEWLDFLLEQQVPLVYNYAGIILPIDDDSAMIAMTTKPVSPW
jgi:hypothetical protein